MSRCFQEQGDAPEMEASASTALQNPVPGLGSQPFLRPPADAGLAEAASRKQEYDNPYFEPQYGFPSEDDPDSEEQVESYTPRFNQNLNGNKCVHYINDCIFFLKGFVKPRCARVFPDRLTDCVVSLRAQRPLRPSSLRLPGESDGEGDSHNSSPNSTISNSSNDGFGGLMSFASKNI